MLRREDPDFVPPNPHNASSRLNNVTQEKRSRDGDEEALDSARHRKRERQDEDGEEMELEDDDDSESRNAAQGTHLIKTLQIRHLRS